PRRGAGQGRAGAARPPSPSPPTGPHSPASSAPYSPNNTTNGSRAAATGPSTSLPEPASVPPPPRRAPRSSYPNWRPQQHDPHRRHPRPARAQHAQCRAALRRHRYRLLGRPWQARSLARRHRRMEAHHRRTRQPRTRRRTLLTNPTRKISPYTTSRDLTEWEARFEPKFYGFRPGRGCDDAIGAIYSTLNGCNPHRVWILDADLTAALDAASYCFFR